MRYLFLDTNIYETCRLMRVNGHTPALLNKARRFSSSDGGLLLVPEVVSAELHRHLKYTPHHDDVERFMSSEGILHLPLTPDALVKAMIWSIKGDRPARVSDEQSGTITDILGDAYYKYGAEQDCLILATLSEFMQERPDDHLVICAGDKRWFSQGELVDSITREFNCSVTAYDDLTVLLQGEFKEQVAAEVAVEYARVASSLQAIKASLALSGIGSATSLVQQSISKSLAALDIKPGTLQAFADMQRSAALDIKPGTIQALADMQRSAALVADSTSRLFATSGLDAVAKQMRDANLVTARLYGVGSPLSKVVQQMNEQNARLLQGISDEVPKE